MEKMMDRMDLQLDLNSMKEYGIAQDKLNSEEYFSNHRDF